MSGEKIDLAEVEAITRRWYGMTHPVLALVRAVRAAQALNNTPARVNNWKALDAALSPFTDSAEDKT